MSTYKYFGVRKLLLGKNDRIDGGSIARVVSDYKYCKPLIDIINSFYDRKVMVLYADDKLIENNDRMYDNFIRGSFTSGYVEAVRNDDDPKQKQYLKFFLRGGIMIPEVKLSSIYDIVAVEDINLQADCSDTLGKEKLFKFFPLTEDDNFIYFRVRHRDPFNAYSAVIDNFRLPVMLSSISETYPGMIDVVKRGK